MGTLTESLRDATNKLGVGGVAALAAGAVLLAGVGAVGAVGGGPGGTTTDPVSISVPADDDGTPDRGSGDAPGTPGATSTTVTSTTVASSNSTSTSTSTTVAPTPAPPAGVTRTIPVPGVGTVVISEGAALGLVSATPAAGFTVRSEASAREIHVRFFDAFGGRIDVKVEIEDAATRIRIRDRRIEDEDRSGPGRGGDDGRPSTTVPSAPTPTIDDHGGDRDRDDRVELGDDRDDSDDDSSGRGRGGDEDRDDD